MQETFRADEDVPGVKTIRLIFTPKDIPLGTISVDGLSIHACGEILTTTVGATTTCSVVKLLEQDGVQLETVPAQGSGGDPLTDRPIFIDQSEDTTAQIIVTTDEPTTIMQLEVSATNVKKVEVIYKDVDGVELARQEAVSEDVCFFQSSKID